MREAPSRTLMEVLWQSGAIVQAYDPVAMEEAERIYGKHAGLTLCGDKYEALRGCRRTGYLHRVAAVSRA